MLERLAQPDPVGSEPNLLTFQGDAEDHLLRELLPGMFYATESSPEALSAEHRFRQFMAPHMVPQDVETMVSLVPSVRHGLQDALRHLELLVRKAVALQREDWKRLESLRSDLAGFEPPHSAEG